MELAMKAPREVPLSYRPRRCEVCGGPAEAFAAREWTINSFIPGGRTVHYKCIGCQSEVSLRSGWHLVVLSLLAAMLVFVIPIVYERDEMFAFIFGCCVLAYVAYALIVDTMARWKNPRWVQ
jgi:hypothetical protein